MEVEEHFGPHPETKIYRNLPERPESKCFVPI